MKNPIRCNRGIQFLTGAAALIAAVNCSYADTTIAYDVATNSTYSGSFSGLNGGFGFGTWSTSTSGGGSYIGLDGGITYFGLWNNGYGTGTGSFATRTFNSPLSEGQTFSTSFKTGHLNSSFEREGFSLQDSLGNILFSYWQQGGNNANGNYLDANGEGTATGFAYDFNSLDQFEFVLDSATTYTFTDLATSAVLTGTISGTINQVEFFRQNLDGDPNTGGGGGTDFRFHDLSITAAPEPSIFALAGLGGLGMLLSARRRRLTEE
jgi:MYXO-CTERM domain-containing protein